MIYGFSSAEVEFLVGLVNDRIIEADSVGIAPRDSSSVFRRELLEKLEAMRRSARRGDVLVGQQPPPARS